MADCVFCTNKEIQARTIIRNRLVWAFPTNIPITLGHTLICPTRHVMLIEDLSPEEQLAMLALTKEIKDALVKVFHATGFNYAWNENKIAGQSVPHLHLHVIPRKVGDEGVHQYDPRKFIYRPGSRETNPEQELQAVAQKIKHNLV